MGKDDANPPQVSQQVLESLADFMLSTNVGLQREDGSYITIGSMASAVKALHAGQAPALIQEWAAHFIIELVPLLRDTMDINVVVRDLVRAMEALKHELDWQ
jgi:hypothetical protein